MTMPAPGTNPPSAFPRSVPSENDRALRKIQGLVGTPEEYGIAVWRLNASLARSTLKGERRRPPKKAPRVVSYGRRNVTLSLHPVSPTGPPVDLELRETRLLRQSPPGELRSLM